MEKAYDLTVDEIGRILLPGAIREKLGMEAGRPVKVELYEADGVVMIKVASESKRRKGTGLPPEMGTID